mmetsp:Transcript_29883/g.45689  ORF Transcript_29883/g.45689 Transcript_29883/m.45689 type:complete len:148 (-) Transcript_29883:248-691(-)
MGLRGNLNSFSAKNLLGSVGTYQQLPGYSQDKGAVSMHPVERSNHPEIQKVHYDAPVFEKQRSQTLDKEAFPDYNNSRRVIKPSSQQTYYKIESPRSRRRREREVRQRSEREDLKAMMDYNPFGKDQRGYPSASFKRPPSQQMGNPS